MEIELQNIPDQYKSFVEKILQENRSLKSENFWLKEQVRLYLQRTFASKADKIPEGQALLFNEVEEEVAKEEKAEEKSEVASHNRSKPKRKPIPKDLPRIDKIYELGTKELICSLDGSKLVKIGEDISEQLDIIPAKIRVIRHVRFKYACKCCEENIKTAPMDPQPIPKSLASPGLLAHIAISKYEDSLPLYRQEKILQRVGIDIPRSSLANWMIKVSRLIKPIMDQLKKDLIQSNYLQCDETPVQVLREPGKTPQSRSYMWVVVRAGPEKNIVIYHYSPSRSGLVPKNLLSGFMGCLQTDGYEGYNQITANPDVYGMACLAHIRRKFVDAVKALKSEAKDGLCVRGLDYINRLYRIEKIARNMTWEERFDYRQEHAVPIIEELKDWLFNKVNYVVPKSLTGKAMGYFVKQWPKFISYLRDGQIEIDNNRCERMIRNFAIGRKNWTFSTSVAGAEASADLYSLIVTAKNNGHNTYDYLRMLFTELPKNQGSIDHLMPYKKLH